MDLKKWFDESIREQVLKVLQALAEEFKEGAEEFNWRKAVEVFGQFCNGALPDGIKNTVEKVIDTLGFTNEVAKLKEFWKNIPEQVRVILAETLEDYKKIIQAKLLGSDGAVFSTDDLSGPWNSVLNFKAEADLALMLQSMDKNSDTLKKMQLECPAAEEILKLGLLGQITLHAGASLPIKFPTYFAASISAGLSASGKGALEYYFHNERKKFFWEALIEDIDGIPSPWNSTGIATDLRHHLSALQLSVEGSLEANIGISGGVVWGADVSVKSRSLDMDTHVQVDAGIKVRYQTNLSLKDSWNVLVKPYSANKNTLYVKIEKDKTKSTTKSFSLDATVGISGLDQVGDALIKKYMPDADGLLEQLTPYLNIGDLLKKKVEEKLDDLLDVGLGGSSEALKTTLISLLVGESHASDLSNAIGEAAKTVINDNLDSLEKIAATAGETVLKKISDLLTLPNNTEVELIKVAKNKMNGFLEDINNDLKGHLEKLITDNKGKLTIFFKPLEEFNVNFNNVQGELNVISAQLFGPLIQYLKKYQELRKTITKTIAASKRLTLGMHLKRITEYSTSDETLLEFVMDVANPKVREYYKEMLLGNFRNALVAARVEDFNSTGIMVIGGVFKEVVSHKVTSDVLVNFFGMKFSAQTVKRSEVHVEMDVSGNILIAESKAEFKRVISGFGETKSVQFLNHFELLGAIPKAGVPPTLKIIDSGLNLFYKDETLKRKELERYLGSFEWRNLVASETTKKVLTRFDELDEEARKRHDKNQSVEIGLIMPITTDDLKVLMNRSDADIISIATQNQLDSYFFNDPKRYKKFVGVLNRWDNRAQRNLNPVHQIKKLALYFDDETLKERYGSKSDEEIYVLAALRKYDLAQNNGNENLFPEKVDAESRKRVKLGIHIGGNAANLVKIIQNFRNATNMTITGTISEEDKKTLNRYNNEMNRYLKDWLKVKGFFATIGLQNEAIPAVTRAFIATIADLCCMGEDGTSYLTMTVKWPLVGDEMELY